MLSEALHELMLFGRTWVGFVSRLIAFSRNSQTEQLPSSAREQSRDSLRDCYDMTALPNSTMSSPSSSMDLSSGSSDIAGSRYPVKIYSRNSLLSLYDSPLVQPPPGLRDLKDWYGSVVCAM